MSRIILGLISVILIFPSHTNAETVNAGFVQGLWYSKPELVENVSSRIYAAIRNNTPHDLTGTVLFTDNGTRIGSTEVRALSGRIIEAWVDITPKRGEHTFVASLVNVVLHPVGSTSIPISDITIEVTGSSRVDTDNDRDGIGDGTDSDDDNDSIADTDEAKNGTDPLVPNQATPPKTSTTSNESKADPVAVSDTPPSPREELESREGLETYLDPGIPDTILTTVTKKIEDTRKRVDGYRKERTESFESEKDKDAIVPLGTYSDTATITREKIHNEKSFLQSFVDGVRKILHLIWTFVLFVFSHILRHPAFVQVLLLLFLLYFFYRIARRIGSRQN